MFPRPDFEADDLFGRKVAEAEVEVKVDFCSSTNLQWPASVKHLMKPVSNNLEKLKWKITILKTKINALDRVPNLWYLKMC